MFTPDDVLLVENAVNNSLNDGIPYSIQHRIITLDKEIKYVWERGELVYGQNKEPLKMVGTVQDITDIKLLEAELHAKDQQYKYFFENSLVGTFHANYKEKRVIRANEKAALMMGYNFPEELMDGFYKTQHHAESGGRETIYNELGLNNNKLVKTVRFKKKEWRLILGADFFQK